jgi:hypothetical protein
VFGSAVCNVLTLQRNRITLKHVCFDRFGKHVPDNEVSGLFKPKTLPPPLESH